DRVRISRRFCGPPASGNGGYSCGLLARYLKGPVEVTLRLPPPLEEALSVVAVDHGRVQLLQDDRLIAEAQAMPLELTVPEPPDAVEVQAVILQQLHPAVIHRDH